MPENSKMKKIIALILLVALATATLAACGGTSTNTLKTSPSVIPVNNDNTTADTEDEVSPAANANNSGKTSASTQQPAGKTEINLVVWDGEGFKVILTGYQHRELWEDHCFYITLENNTDKNIRAKFERLSVNGCMVTGASFSENERIDAGETRDDTKLIIGESFMAERGIVDLQNIEFEISFLDLDDVQNLLFYSDKIVFTMPDNSGSTQQYNPGGLPVFDSEGVKISVIRAEEDIMGGTYNGIWVYMENNSGSDIEVRGSGSPGLSCEITDGMVAFDYILFSTFGSDLQFHSQSMPEARVFFGINRWNAESHYFDGDDIKNTLGDDYGSLDVTFDDNGTPVSAVTPQD